jgi:hypothetical protein
MATNKTSSRSGALMTSVSRRSWTPTQIELLFSLVERGVSPARASVVLKRPKLAVQNKARQLGKPFPDVRDVRAARLAREISEIESIKRREAGKKGPPRQPEPAHKVSLHETEES